MGATSEALSLSEEKLAVGVLSWSGELGDETDGVSVEEKVVVAAEESEESRTKAEWKTGESAGENAEEVEPEMDATRNCSSLPWVEPATGPREMTLGDKLRDADAGLSDAETNFLSRGDEVRSMGAVGGDEGAAVE